MPVSPGSVVLMVEAKGQRTGGGLAHRSVLEPHWDFIREMRRRRMTWKEIAERLQSDLGLRVTLFGVYRFCRRRARRKSSWESPGTPLPGAIPTTDRMNGSAPASPAKTLPEASVALASGPTQAPRQPTLAALPVDRGFRRPQLADLTLNDPLKP